MVTICAVILRTKTCSAHCTLSPHCTLKTNARYVFENKIKKNPQKRLEKTISLIFIKNSDREFWFSWISIFFLLHMLRSGYLRSANPARLGVFNKALKLPIINFHFIASLAINKKR